MRLGRAGMGIIRQTRREYREARHPRRKAAARAKLRKLGAQGG